MEGHFHLGHLTGGEDPEGSDGEVERESRRVDRDPLGPDQAEGLMYRTEDVGAQGDGVEELAGPDLHRDRAAPGVPRPVGAR